MTATIVRNALLALAAPEPDPVGVPTPEERAEHQAWHSRRQAALALARAIKEKTANGVDLLDPMFIIVTPLDGDDDPTTSTENVRRLLEVALVESRDSEAIRAFTLEVLS